ncbi:MAG: prepilin-type N-terminal cleavage/methylation domain-containing protein [Arenicellales bacterium]
MDIFKQKGYLLIEVMVTISLLAIGITGYTSAQIKALRLNLDAQTNSNITLANAAILDQFRLHPELAASGAFNVRIKSDSSYDTQQSIIAELDDIIAALSSTGTEAWIDISCDAETMTICEICFENMEQIPQASNETEHSNRGSIACSRQIIM